MTQFSSHEVMAGLTDFQRRSVDHVVEQFYGPRRARRFLVADETGLGKSMVARGVVARAIEELQDEPSVKRIDVVYVCANADLAQQNIQRLHVTDDEVVAFASRLTLLGTQSQRLNKRSTHGKPVNLVSFTPGTSFDMGYSTGRVDERAMLLLALQQIREFSRTELTAAERLLQGSVSDVYRFRSKVDELARQIGNSGIDRRIVSNFKRHVRAGGLQGILARFENLVAEMGRRRSVPDHLREANLQLIRDLRATLARASVDTLEPDLVILDEFQRFRHLLDRRTPAGELAHDLFDYPDAKALLLSATPYKPFAYTEEDEDDHAADFYGTLRFLAEGRDDVDLDGIRTGFEQYRAAAESGRRADDVVAQLRRELLTLMSRCERPVLPDGTMTRELLRPAATVTADDLTGYVALHDLAAGVAHPNDRGLVSTEYWKSAPYFVTFCDGYRLGARIRDAGLEADIQPLLGTTQSIRAQQITGFRRVSPGNARMVDLLADTVDQDWWKLLWIPPSLPYFKPRGAYAAERVELISKRVVFSSWTATPTAVASILSYEAERRAAAGTNYRTYTPQARRRLTTPLNYSLRQGLPARMSTLMTFWAMPGLAELADPLDLTAANDGRPVGPGDAINTVRRRIASAIGEAIATAETEPADATEDVRDTVWRAAFSMDSNWPALDLDAQLSDFADAMAGRAGQDDDETSDRAEPSGLVEHLELALEARALPPTPPDQATVQLLARVALFSPGNIAYRVLRRLVGPKPAASEAAVVQAALGLANGLRSLFNRPDVTKILEHVTDAGPYWRNVLQYCGYGNLEAVLDEYLHHLRHDQFSGPLDDEALTRLVERASGAMTLRTTTYQALNVDDLDDNLTFVPRFALRYGGRKQDAEAVRQPEVRQAFNSPFWPFVLASTSVGQEGIDFHWWCHSVFHWNTPANPVDFEQREGRVDRYRGLAVRRNIAHRHGDAMRRDAKAHPWDVAYRLANDYCDQYGDFTPNWVYPGPAKIERHVAPFALSSDIAKYDRIKKGVALYRLTFGQPRQEDMLEVLESKNLAADPDLVNALKIDLSP